MTHLAYLNFISSPVHLQIPNHSVSSKKKKKKNPTKEAKNKKKTSKKQKPPKQNKTNQQQKTKPKQTPNKQNIKQCIVKDFKVLVMKSGRYPIPGNIWSDCTGT